MENNQTQNTDHKLGKSGSQNLPEVTIWVAARDEAERLPLLLASLLAQDYPTERLQILIGNDQSTDQTAGIVTEISQSFTQIKLVDIPNYNTHLRSKSRVLNYLAGLTNTDYVLITDADIVLPPTWVRAMITELLDPANGQPVHLVSGITTMLGTSVYSRIQGLDWLTALFTVSLLDKVNVGVTALGNNMAFDFRAYQTIGGYAALPASIVEDFQLYMAFRDGGFQTANRYSGHLLATTFAPETWSGYIKQRVRWLSGGLQTDAVVRTIFFAQFGWYPVLGIVALSGMGTLSTIAALLVIVRYLSITTLCYFAILKADNPRNNLISQFWALPWLFELYFIVGYVSTIYAYYANPVVDWKGRTYPQK